MKIDFYILSSFLPPGGRNVHSDGGPILKLKKKKKKVGVAEITSGVDGGHLLEE